MEKINLSKFISRSGFCSRRKAEELILNGKVSVDSKIIQNPALDIDFQKQNVFVDGKKIMPLEKVRLFLFSKPKGYIVSRSDPKGRPTIYDFIKEKYGSFVSGADQLIYVGRLDFNSEGLLLLTNFGPIARFFELPSNKIKRVYELKIFGKWRDQISEILMKGVTVKGVRYAPIKTEILKKQDKQIWIRCELFEGKKNELRKVFNHFDFLVSHLKRVSYGEFSLSFLERGGLKEMPEKVISKILQKIEKSEKNS